MRTIRHAIGAAILFLIASTAAAENKLAPDPTTELISRSSAGAAGNAISHAPALSADGRMVAFVSDASNLVEDDTNDYPDIFVHDRWTGITRRVSVSSTGAQVYGDPSRPSISADGRYVAYSSDADGLVPEDENEHHDVFVYDLSSGVTQIVSVDPHGDEGNHDSFTRRPSLSSDGRYVVFFSAASDLVADDANAVMDVFLYDRLSGEMALISKSTSGEPGNGDSTYPTISADGEYIAYYSAASNLVPGDDNDCIDVFLYERQTGITTRVSEAPGGSDGNDVSDLPSISADGRYVAFFSAASNLVPDDDNGVADVFVHDTQTGETVLASIASDGVTQADALSDVPSLSADGRYIAFYSFADNLVPEDDNGYTDVFRRDLQDGVTIRVSVGSQGEQGTHDSLCSAISADGMAIGFYSYAGNLVPGDINNQADVFVRDLAPIEIHRLRFPWLSLNVSGAAP